MARRLQSLGALTRGDRRAASGLDLSELNFDSPLVSCGKVLDVHCGSRGGSSTHPSTHPVLDQPTALSISPTGLHPPLHTHPSHPRAARACARCTTSLWWSHRCCRRECAWHRWVWGGGRRQAAGGLMAVHSTMCRKACWCAAKACQPDLASHSAVAPRPADSGGHSRGGAGLAARGGCAACCAVLCSVMVLRRPC